MSLLNTTQGEDEIIRRATGRSYDSDVAELKAIIMRLDSIIEEQRKRIIELEDELKVRTSGEI